ncbi:RNA 2',3'-cyclic phosphodiesterase [Paenibacillus solisilvae]|uniref:RNA 2',3'-cyclic phosphodiesterase n=1 Tax=Paenibacillus solisilvae TaxID=2486751 RepID=A0ABW0W8V0_9BACL
MSNTEDTRIFIAVPLPDELKKWMAGWAETLKQALPSFRKWVYAEDYHITLQFLGDIPKSQVPHLAKALQDELVSRRTHDASFELSVGALGLFGRPSSPSILWAGIGGDTNRLDELHTIVSKALTPLGFPPEKRPFNPHLTLARKYEGTVPFDAAHWIGGQAPVTVSGEPLRFQVREIVLYASHLGRLPMYEPVEHVAL